MLGKSAMELFTVTPADHRFLVRSMRCHGLIWLIVGSVFTICSLFPSKGPYAAKPQAGVEVSGIEVPGIEVAGDEIAVQIDAHVPVGWRRTTDGWEHTSNWLSPDKSIDTWIAEQRSREPAWIQSSLAMIRNTPPLVFAMLQISMITLVVLITTRKKLMV